MGIFDKFLSTPHNGLKKSVEDIEAAKTASVSMVPSLVMMNDGVDICAIACSSCWDTKLPDDYFERAKYIGRRTKTGHTSIIEHSNVVFYLFVPVERTVDLLEFLDTKNYLHTCIKVASNSSGFHMLVGGTWRAFSDLYLNTYDFKTNSVMITLTRAIQQYVPSDGMRDIIDYGILNEEDFSNIDGSQIAQRYQAFFNKRIDDDINIVNCDSIYQLTYDLQSVCDESYLFTVKDLLKFCTITVEFNHMSRIITQQLTRHRNGITQESQRYVDYSGAPFNSPAKFKPDKYNTKRLYEFKFGGQSFKMNLQNLGESINKIYEQLKDKSKYGTEALLSEDARGYLAQNTQCGKIYMTFNYWTFIKFLQLREDKHAQAEIKSYADRLGKWFRENIMTGGPDATDLYDALVPNCIAKNDFDNVFMSVIGEGKDPERSSLQLDENEVGEALSDEEYAKIYEDSIKKEDEESSSQENS